jgi:hypothetical protein
MVSRNRNKRILMDNLSGIPMADIATREGLHTSRVGQICQAVLRQYGCTRDMTKAQIGARLTRGYSCASADSPEGFHYELAIEHERDFMWRREG